MADYSNITDFNGLQNGDTVVFEYTGDKAAVSLPPGKYRLKCYGAQGGYRSSSANGGQGGYAEGILTLTEQQSAYFYVGGSGNSGGFNGGGSRTNSLPGGGGATDIRLGEDSLFARLIVAGGGGSDGASSKPGGHGGGAVGVSRTESYGSGGAGASQTASGDHRGAFGFGGAGQTASNGYGGAGGGGWYGGGGVNPDGSGDDDRGGGGGSGYVLTTDSVKPEGYLLGDDYYLTEIVMSQGGRDGDGLIVVEVIEIGTQKFLTKDADGIKTWDGEKWIQISGSLSEEMFLEHGLDKLPQSVDGLLDDAELLLWTDRKYVTDNPQHFQLELSAEASPPTQTITQTVPFDMPPNAIIDYVSLVADTQNGGSVSYGYTVTEDGICFVYTLEKPDSNAVSGIKKTNTYFAEV